MPGYETYRFVDAVAEDLEDYICGICHAVLNRPVVSRCCGQSYCDDCIKQWLLQSNTCPYDRQPLRVRELIQSPKSYLNMLNKLKIKCEFEARGCDQTIPLSDLTLHSRKCRFNPDNFCQTCGETSDGHRVPHDCVTILRARIDSITDEIRRIRAENLCLKDEIRISTDKTDRTVTVLKSEMSKLVEQKAIDISTEALDKCDGNRVEMARHIAWGLDNEFGSGWNCFVSHGSNWGSLVKAYRNNYLQLKLGSNEIVVYETRNDTVLSVKNVMILLVFAFLIHLFYMK